MSKCTGTDGRGGADVPEGDDALYEDANIYRSGAASLCCEFCPGLLQPELMLIASMPFNTCCATEREAPV